MECNKCGISDELTPLFDVISDEGIVKLCKKCLSFENVPVIRRPTKDQIDNEHKSMYKRLSEAAGLDADEHRKNLLDAHRKELMDRKDITLRDIIDKKYDTFVKKPINKNEDLIENYHWIIMRARRNKKLTSLQLAEKMKVPERLIKMAEQGMLPEGDYEVIRKFEEHLGIRILRPEVAEELERQKKQLGFDEDSAKSITISDLQKIKQELNPPKKEPYWKRFMDRLTNKPEKKSEEIEFEIKRDVEPVSEPVEKPSEPQDRTDSFEVESPKDLSVELGESSLEMSSDSKKEKKADLSEDDINDLIFGRK